MVRSGRHTAVRHVTTLLAIEAGVANTAFAPFAAMPFASVRARALRGSGSLPASSFPQGRFNAGARGTHSQMLPLLATTLCSGVCFRRFSSARRFGVATRQRLWQGSGGGACAVSFASRNAIACAAASGPRVAFLIGGPGSGKGTQCERIVRDFGYKHLSAGELLRTERQREGSPLGAEIERVIRAGSTVPSEMIAALLEQAMRDAGWADSKFIIDGYPRSVEQLEGWEATLSKQVRFLCCLSLNVGKQEMRRRLLGRAATSGRIDDNEETILKRFDTFEKETGPLLAHFERKGQLQVIDGERGLEEVWASVQAIFNAAESEDGEGRGCG